MDFGPDTFFLRVPDNAMEPAFRAMAFTYLITLESKWHLV